MTTPLTNQQICDILDEQLKSLYCSKAELLEDNGVNNFEQLCSLNDEEAEIEYEKICDAASTLNSYKMQLSSLLNTIYSYIEINLA